MVRLNWGTNSFDRSKMMFKLQTPMTDKATGLDGHLTHLQVEGGNRMYIFQPKGLTDEGEPIDSFWISPDRVVGGEEIPDPYLGLEILGSIVKDKATGFEGMAVASVLHPNGCLHLDVQPAGKTKSGKKVPRHNFDLRELEGEKIQSR